jgi:hypothetical protein
MEDHDRVLVGAEGVPDGTQHPENVPLMIPVPKNSATDKQRNIEIYTNCGSNFASDRAKVCYENVLGVHY